MFDFERMFSLFKNSTEHGALREIRRNTNSVSRRQGCFTKKYASPKAGYRAGMERAERWWRRYSLERYKQIMREQGRNWEEK